MDERTKENVMKNMAAILNQHQAEAMASAMAALNNVGGKISAVMDDAIKVLERDDGSIMVQKKFVNGDWKLEAYYSSQNDFLAAYGID